MSHGPGPCPHPSYLLRLPDGEKPAAWAAFLADLRAVREMAA
ncbi:hypothetical protein [Amaricoccus sp.]|nr:hypothetical protein [Amaricoccus sp.]